MYFKMFTMHMSNFKSIQLIMRISQIIWHHVSQKSTIWSNRGEIINQIGNAFKNSRKIDTHSKHAQVYSCKNPDHFEFKKHGNKNHEVGHEWCDTNCHTPNQKSYLNNQQ